MSKAANGSAYGRLIEPATLRIERLLPGPMERVWAYLTESDLRRQWLAAGNMELALGASFELVWRNNELNNPPTAEATNSQVDHRMLCHITELDPPRRLAFTWQGSGDVSFELTPSGEQVLLTVIHRRLPDRTMLLKVAAGWHMHLDILVARANADMPAPFWDGWNRLQKDYDTRFPG